MRPELAVIDCRAAKHRRARFELLKQFPLVAHADRSLRRNFQADPQFQWQADEHEVAAQLGRETSERLHPFAAGQSASLQEIAEVCQSQAPSHVLAVQTEDPAAQCRATRKSAEIFVPYYDAANAAPVHPFAAVCPSRYWRFAQARLTFATRRGVGVQLRRARLAARFSFSRRAHFTPEEFSLFGRSFSSFELRYARILGT